MVSTVHVGAQIDRIRGEPVTDPIIEGAISKQRPVRALVHDHGEPELSSSDHEQRERNRESVGRPCDHGHRQRDQTVIDEHRRPSAEVAQRTEISDLFGAEMLQ